jgi:integrase
VRVDRRLVTPPDGPAFFGPVKTESSNRVIPLAPEVAEVLAAHLKAYGPGKDELVFTTGEGQPLRRSALSAIVRTATAGVGLSGVTFRDLRHFAASALIASGCSVKAAVVPGARIGV